MVYSRINPDDDIVGENDDICSLVFFQFAPDAYQKLRLSAGLTLSMVSVFEVPVPDRSKIIRD